MPETYTLVSFLLVSFLILVQVFCRDSWPQLSNQQAQIQPLPQWGPPKQTTSFPSIRQRINYYDNFNNNNYNNNRTGGYVQNTRNNQPPTSTGSNYNSRNNYNQNQVFTNQGEVNDDEIRSFSEMLLSKDQNSPARYVRVNYQGKTTSRSTRDEAPLPLLSINQEAFRMPTITKMIKLYDNYILQTTQEEQYTNEERQEEEDLINSIINTPVMEYTRNFLIQKGRISNNLNEFKNILKEIWFNMYTRGSRKVSSSGFEHVFLAEIKNNQISGLHNWIYFNQQEQQNKANYLGYMKKIDLGNKGAILKYHFTFHGIDKPVGSMFIGTSPELEMALYTTCFLLRADKVCPLTMNGNRFIIRTFTYTYRGKKLIGSAFPEI